MKTDRNTLVSKHSEIVERIVGCFQRSGLPPTIEVDDLRQEGYIALISALDSYRPKTPAPIESYLAKSISRALVAAIKKEQRHWDHRSAYEELFRFGEPRL